MVKESEQIDFLKLDEKKYENLVDFIFGFARAHFSEQYRISDSQHSKFPKDIRYFNKDEEQFFFLTFENELNNKNFYVKLGIKEK